MLPNPERLLLALDERLDHPIRLVLFGRSAIWLGFENAPPETAATKDVDAIIELSQLDEVVNDGQFWDARDAVKAAFDGEGLYITHLFQENQIFLRKCRQQQLVRVDRPSLRHIKLWRPATIDLVLTKMMRGADEEDLKDIAFYIERDHLTKSDFNAAFAEMQPIELEELEEAFTRAKPAVLARAYDL